MIVRNERKGLKFSWLNIYFKFKWHLKIKWFKLKNPRRSMFESYQSQHLFFCFVLFYFILFLWILIFTKRMKWKRNIMYIRSFTLFFYSLLLYTFVFFSSLFFSSLSFLSSLCCDIKNALSRFRTCDPGVISTMLYRLSYESLTIYL